MSHADSEFGERLGKAFGTMPDGRVAKSFVLSDGVLEAVVTDFGARLARLRAPDRNGEVEDVVLGHDEIEPYLADRTTYMGATVGRLANRLAGGSFTLGGTRYQVPRNNGPNALHGGTEGFDRKVWSVAEVSATAVTLDAVSGDKEMGFPGTLEVSVRYSLQGGALRVEYEAKTDQATVVNLTNHAYFNLAGEKSRSVLGHEVMLPAANFTPIDENLVPTGELRAVAGTAFDFRTPRAIGERIEADDEQLRLARGYDHNWASGEPGAMKLVARVTEPESGRVLTVETTEPGVQLYTGNFLDGTVPARGGDGVYGMRSGFCLETQGYPDAPNHPGFPSVVLRPGERFKSMTVFGF